MERRLAAIIAADVVGYSRLMNQDEAGVLNRLQMRFRNIIEPAIAEYRGRLIKTMGDGFLAEFSSALDAVHCAAALQERNIRADSELPASQRMRLRIGISVGDIMLSNGDIFGTGVNLAARLQEIAEPDGICVTAAAAEQVRGKTTLSIRNRGPQRLHNFDEDVPVFDLVATPSSPAAKKQALRPAAADRPSIAVLPLDDMRAEDTDKYFADGVSEDIITELSRFRSLTVIARNSSFRYRGGNVDIAQVHRDLGAQFVLEGSIQKQRDQIRITVQLINAVNHHHVWAEKYDCAVDGLFAVRDEITRMIVGRTTYQVETSLLVERKRRDPADLHAYDLYLRGADRHETGGEKAFSEAKHFYLEAIAADPTFARPHAGLAELLYIEERLASWGAAEMKMEKAFEYARRAVELDEQEAHGHAILAFILLYHKQFARAERSLARAVELNPNDADIAMLRASQLAHMGDSAQALELASRALTTNPFHPDWYLSELAIIHCLAGRYSEAVSNADLVDTHYPHSAAWIAIAHAHLGNIAEAHAAASQFVDHVRPIWKGDPAATKFDYARWLLAFIPVAAPADRARIAEGLRLAGLLPQRAFETSSTRLFWRV